jgi:hypothetical protein
MQPLPSEVYSQRLAPAHSPSHHFKKSMGKTLKTIAKGFSPQPGASIATSELYLFYRM